MFCFNNRVETTSHISMLTELKDILKQLQEAQVIHFKLLLKMKLIMPFLKFLY